MSKEAFEIGIARLTYNPDGSIRTGTFEPTLAIDVKGLRKELNACKGKTIDDVKNTAELMLGSFFSRMTEIELADREKYAVKSNILYASTYDNTSIKEVAIEFYFTEI